MIHEKVLELKAEVEAKCGKVVKITLDKEGNRQLRNELSVPIACKNMLFGIVFEVAKECPICGQGMGT